MARRAIELVRRHGWSEELLVRSEPNLNRGQERSSTLFAENWNSCAVATLRRSPALEAGQRLAGMLAATRPVSVQTKSGLLLTLLKLGETERVEQALAKLTGEVVRIGGGQIRLPPAALQLARGDPQTASFTLAPSSTARLPCTATIG